VRLAVKSVLAILVFYVVLLGGISLWLEYKFSSLATALVRNTARLIGNEIAGVVSGAALDRLVKGERADRDRLAEIVARVTEESDVVDSLAVVDKSGKVVAGDQQHVGRQLTPPQVLFAERERVELSSPNLLKGGDYHLFVALTAQEEVVGYLRRRSAANGSCASIARRGASWPTPPESRSSAPRWSGSSSISGSRGGSAS
jgi:hypothetical protein